MIILKTVAFVVALSLGANVAEAHGGGGGSDTGLIIFDIFVNLLSLGLEVAAIESATAATAPPPPPMAYEQQRLPSRDEDPPPSYWRGSHRRFQSREGLLVSAGIGGGSMFVSNQSAARTGAFDIDFRLGYGFSDRFQFFLDADLGAGSYANGVYGRDDLATWTVTFRGQTVLVGDRAGNGLNLNLGIGLGGVTRNSGYSDQSSSPTGLALAGGLSYDARITPWFALSPEFFYTWHEIPAGGLGRDVASVYGLRMNFLWYLH